MRRSKTTKEIADYHKTDAEIRVQLNNMQYDANIEANQLNREEKSIPQFHPGSLMKQIAQYHMDDAEYRYKLDRIAENSVLPPSERISNFLTPIDQEKIDFYRANTKNIINPHIDKPDFVKEPASNADWAAINFALSDELLVQEQQTLKNALKEAEDKIPRIRERLAGYLRKKEDRLKLALNLRAYEKRLATIPAKLYAIKDQINAIQEQRLLYLEDIKKDNAELTNEYIKKFDDMNAGNLALARMAGESDEAYTTRIDENINALTYDDVMHDANMFISQQFIKLLQNTGIDLSIVEQVANRLNNIAKERILKTKDKFLKRLNDIAGKQLYKLSVDDIQEIINNYEGLNEGSTLLGLSSNIADINKSFQEEKDNKKAKKESKTKAEKAEKLADFFAKAKEEGEQKRGRSYEPRRREPTDQEVRFDTTGSAREAPVLTGRWSRGKTYEPAPPLELGEEAGGEEESKTAPASRQDFRVLELEYFRSLGKTDKKKYFMELLKNPKNNKLVLDEKFKAEILGGVKTWGDIKIEKLDEEFANFLELLRISKLAIVRSKPQAAAAASSPTKKSFLASMNPFTTSKKEDEEHQEGRGFKKSKPKKKQHLTDLAASNLKRLKNTLKMIEQEILVGNDNKQMITDANLILTEMVKLKAIGTKDKNKYLKQLKKIN